MPNRPIGRGQPLRGERAFNTPGGYSVYRTDGSMRYLRTRDIEITRTRGGGRTVVAERMDHSRLVVTARGHGYIQRPFFYGGSAYARRTYVDRGVVYNRFYRHYQYNDRVALELYAPTHYYSPAFYGWAYHPWARPIAYRWGWEARPWYRVYGAYFTPYPYYAGPSAWLTDHLVSSSLEAAYQHQVDSANPYAGNPYPNTPYLSNQYPNNPYPSSAPMSPEVKAYIEQEVKRDISMTNDERRQMEVNQQVDPNSNNVVRVLSDNRPHVFVAGSEILVTDVGNTECSITPGDSIRFSPPPPDANAADAVGQVLWSKQGNDCAIGSTIHVNLADLQEMWNYMRAVTDQGMSQLLAQQGNGQIPPAPAVATVPPAPSPITNYAPPPEPNLPGQVDQQGKAADKTEKENGGR